jgi:enoyl-CoA hydratase/carnithine racemase
MTERRIETVIDIDAPPSRVWTLLTGFARMPAWNPFIKSISGSLTQGARLSVSAAVNGPVRLHSEYILLADIVLATPSTVFQDKPHFELGVASGDGVHLLWQEAIGNIRGRYFIMNRQELDAQTAKDWGAVNEIVPADKLLPRSREIAEGLAKLPSLTTKYTRIAMTQKLRRIIDEGVTLGLALEGISAADVAQARTK